MIYFFKEEKEKERETKIQREKYDIFNFFIPTYFK